MPFESTLGSASANSYVTVGEADAYFEFHLYADLWPATSEEADVRRKQQALVMATRALDTQEYIGYRKTSTQSLKWPRFVCATFTANDLYTFGEGTLPEELTGGAIPARLKDAVCDLALHLLANDPTADVDESLSQFSSISLPGISLSMRAGAREGGLPSHVFEKIYPLLVMAGGARLVRA